MRVRFLVSWTCYLSLYHFPPAHSLTHSTLPITLVVGLFVFWLTLLLLEKTCLLVEKDSSNNKCIAFSRNSTSVYWNGRNKKLENFGNLTKSAKAKWDLESCLLSFSYDVTWLLRLCNYVDECIPKFQMGTLLFCLFPSFLSLFPHMFTQQLLYIRHCARQWWFNEMQKQA